MGRLNKLQLPRYKHHSVEDVEVVEGVVVEVPVDVAVVGVVVVAEPVQLRKIWMLQPQIQLLNLMSRYLKPYILMITI